MPILPEVDSPIGFILSNPEKLMGILSDVIAENDPKFALMCDPDLPDNLYNQLSEELNGEAARYTESIRKMIIVLLDNMADRHGFTFDHA